jgi:hypothetical protein
MIWNLKSNYTFNVFDPIRFLKWIFIRVHKWFMVFNGCHILNNTINLKEK